VSLSRYVEISCCVLRGGFDSFVRPNAEREILCLVDPETLDSTSFRKGIELIAHITKRLSQSALGLRIATSTTVTTEYPKLSGNTVQRAIGSGIRAISRSPGFTSVHWSSSNFASFTQRSDLSRKTESPTSANCVNRIEPLGS